MPKPDTKREAITSRERILKKIRSALMERTQEPFPGLDITSSVHTSNDTPLDILFAEQFNKIDGQFVFCQNKKEFIANLTALANERNWEHLYCWEPKLQAFFQKKDFRKCRIGKNIEKADAGVTLCESLIARTGSVIISSRQAAGRTLGIFPPVHIVVAHIGQLVYDIKDGLQLIQKKHAGNLPSMISLTSGPSRTADIEKTLVLGAHGPKEIFVFLLDEQL